MTQKLEKPEEIEKRAEELGKKIRNNIASDSEQNLSLLQENRIVDIAEATMKKMFMEEAKKLKLYYEKELAKKQEIIDDLKPREADYIFRKDWHKKIKLITIELYTIKSKDKVKGQCPICNKFEALGYISQLSNLYKEINLPKEKYKLEKIFTDRADRYLNDKKSKSYSNRLTSRGENHFVAKGFSIRGFPTIIINVDFIQGKKERIEPLWDIKEGLGRRDGKIYFGSFIEHIKNFLVNWDEEELMKIPTHELGYMHDMEKK